VPIDGRPPSLITRPPGCAFHPRCAFVREAHKRVDPMLEPVDGRADHEVACLLAQQTRNELWQHLAAGEAPERARAAVPLGDSAE
jgi:peptide/nickel transport system ATP-binding protein